MVTHILTMIHDTRRQKVIMPLSQYVIPYRISEHQSISMQDTRITDYQVHDAVTQSLGHYITQYRISGHQRICRQTIRISDHQTTNAQLVTWSSGLLMLCFLIG